MIKIHYIESGEVALRLRALVALAEDVSLIPSTHMMTQSSLIPVSGDLTPSFDL